MSPPEAPKRPFRQLYDTLLGYLYEDLDRALNAGAGAAGVPTVRVHVTLDDHEIAAKVVAQLGASLDAVIAAGAAQSAPLTTAHAITITLQGGAQHRVLLDPDVLEALLADWHAWRAAPADHRDSREPETLRTYAASPQLICQGRLILDITAVQSIMIIDQVGDRVLRKL